jgi:hypothetical protein
VVAAAAAVDSVFDPPLDTASMRTVSPPSCGTRVAGEELCDPRAACTLAPSGGVHCACDGGLRYKPGAPEDGTQCQQDTFIDMQVLSKLANTRVRKPSNNTGAPSMTIDVRSFDEQPFEAPYHVTMTLIPADVAKLQRDPSANVTTVAPQVLGPTRCTAITSLGAALSNTSFDMDQHALKYSASKAQTLRINANCTADQPCVSDGDTIDTELSLDAPDGGAPVKVKIRTVIESILSCDNSRVLALPADIIVSRATRIRLKFFANDVEDAPVRYTRGEVQFRWAGKSFAAVWVPGRNEYVADVPS